MFLKVDRFTVAATLLLSAFAILLSVELIHKDAPVDWAEDQGMVDVEVFRVPLTEEDVPLRQPENAIDTSDLVSRRIVGGVVPHHLLASEFLAEFFQLLAERPKLPKTIILLSPNHFEVGSSNLQTVEFLWETPYGQVATDHNTLQDLIDATAAEIVPESFKNEHGIYSILPYVAHFLLSVRIVPVIFRYNTSAEEIGELVDFLKPLVESGDTIVIGSVDFSHYLTKAESDNKDAETLRAIQNFDLSRIADFQSDHLDSPATILTLLQLGRETGIKDIHVLRHDNSADNARGNHDSTTGHFSFFFTGLNE
ncbi:MAG: AmmeMemoRadiSam system protein B [Candidatus Moraniibacteriota bacterium]